MFSTTQPFHIKSKKLAYFWLGLSFQAGMLNAGALLACGRFASHLTGSGTQFGVEAALSHWHSALSMLAVPFVFLIGAMGSGFLVDYREAYQKPPRYDVALGIIFLLIVLIVILSQADQFGDFGRAYKVEDNFVFLILLTAACGLQNGLFTRRWGTVIRTTHITGTTTDLAIGLVRMFYLSRNRQPIGDLKRVNLLRFGSISMFMTGSLMGAIVHLHFGYGGFVFPALLAAHFFFVEKRGFRSEAVVEKAHGK